MAVIPIAPACSPPLLPVVRLLVPARRPACRLSRSDLCVYYPLFGHGDPIDSGAAEQALATISEDKHACLDLTVDVFGDQVVRHPVPSIKMASTVYWVLCGMWSVPPPLQYISCLHEKKRRQAHIWILRPHLVMRPGQQSVHTMCRVLNTSARVEYGTPLCRSGTGHSCSTGVNYAPRLQRGRVRCVRHRQSDTMVGVAEEHPSAHCEHRVLPRESDEGPCLGGDTISTHLTRDRASCPPCDDAWISAAAPGAGSLNSRHLEFLVHDHCIEEIKF
jgi:hypothetical protein